jgi:diaminopropionate ammonia-lyase
MCVGMACGIPSTLGWPLLRDLSTAFMMTSESMAANGMKLAVEENIVSGECGAVGLGILNHLMTEQDQKSIEFRNKIGLNLSSNVLLINTEGDTDPTNYVQVMQQEM